VKLTGGANGTGLPWLAAAELALNVGQDELQRWQSERAVDPLVQLVAAAQQPANGGPVGVPVG
jgi:hypothetical protein